MSDSYSSKFYDSAVSMLLEQQGQKKFNVRLNYFVKKMSDPRFYEGSPRMFDSLVKAATKPFKENEQDTFSDERQANALTAFAKLYPELKDEGLDNDGAWAATIMAKNEARIAGHDLCTSISQQSGRSVAKDIAKDLLTSNVFKV